MARTSKAEHYCPHCGSDFIQDENEGANGPRFHTCCICGESRYYSFPLTFPKRLKVTEREFAELWLESAYTQSQPVTREIMKMCLADNKSEVEKK